MSHAQDYLRSILSPAQWQEYKRLAAQDSRDSTARSRWRFIQQSTPRLHRPAIAHAVATARAWLRRNGYTDESGAWTNRTSER